MKVADLKTLEGFKKFFEPFTDEHFTITDYSDHETSVFAFKLFTENDLEDGMHYEFEMEAGNYKSKNHEMDFTFYDKDGENWEEYTLTEEQRNHVYEAIDQMMVYVYEGMAEAAEYNRDIYAYHGHRRSDFY